MWVFGWLQSDWVRWDADGDALELPKSVFKVDSSSSQIWPDASFLLCQKTSHNPGKIRVQHDPERRIALFLYDSAVHATTDVKVKSKRKVTDKWALDASQLAPIKCTNLVFTGRVFTFTHSSFLWRRWSVRPPLCLLMVCELYASWKNMF